MIVGGLLALLLIGAAFMLPIPIFYVFEPGPVLDVERLVRVREGQTYSSEGGSLPHNGGRGCERHVRRPRTRRRR